jgi:aryl-alcohol dehydrogenase-like predicted oxidoreductase
MAQPTPAIVYGSAPIASFSTEVAKEMLDILEKHNVKQIDTASVYPGSELVLGKLGAPKKFIIQTKAPGWSPGALGKQSILDGLKKSLEDLQTDSVDIYYLHAPDPTTPIEDTLSAIQELYVAGKFKRFINSSVSPTSEPPMCKRSTISNLPTTPFSPPSSREITTPYHDTSRKTSSPSSTSLRSASTHIPPSPAVSS